MLTQPSEAVMINSHIVNNDLIRTSEHVHINACSRTSCLPKDGWFGAGLGRAIPVLGPKWVFGHIFADVSSNKREPQHGRQRSIVEHDANLMQLKDVIRLLNEIS